MKKINNMDGGHKKYTSMVENDDVFDPDDNLYNRPEDENISTISYKRRIKVKTEIVSKKRKTDRKNEK